MDGNITEEREREKTRVYEDKKTTTYSMWCDSNNENKVDPMQETRYAC